MSLPSNLRSVPRYMRSTGVSDLQNSSGRLVRYLFSDPSVARDGHTIQGWTVDNFMKNPVFLWAHQTDEPPIGKVVDIEANGGMLSGTVEYAEADLNPFGDMVYRLVKGDYLNAVSVSWDPIKWQMSTDKNRPRGIDFKLVDLLEVSQVPVPALATALATARSAGIDTAPLYHWAERLLDQGGMILVPRDELEHLRRDAKMPASKTRSAAADWKCSAAKDLPIDMESEWDGAAAEKSIFDKAGFDGDAPDTAFAAKAFLAHDAANPDLKGSYKLPIAKVVDGKLVVVAAAVRDAASRLPQTDGLSDAVKKEAQGVIGAYETKMKEDEGSRAAKREALKRSLWDVGDLAYLLMQVVWTQQNLAEEAEWEQDGSPLPGQLADLAKQMGEFLKALTGEETDELIARLGVDDEARSARGQLLATILGLDVGARGGLLAAARHAQAGKVVTITVDASTVPLSRAGKALSSEREAKLRDIHTAMADGCARLMGVIEEATSTPDDEGDDGTDDADDEARAQRGRRAKAIALRHRVLRAV